MGESLARFCIPPTATIRDAIACIDKNGEGIAVAVDQLGRLIATITDGDIRRAILRGTDLTQPITTLLEHRLPNAGPGPIEAFEGTSDFDLLRTMNEHGIRHIPIVNKEWRVVDLALLSQLAKSYELPLTAVVMAGGFGTRLRPMTEDTPKPMLPVGDKPLLEHIIGQLRAAGIQEVTVTTHYKSDVIAKHFGDGRGFGVKVNYLEEDQPLGTAGAVGLMKETDGPLLVMNGDVLTRVDFRAMLDFHREHRAELTTAVKEFRFQVPYGVVTFDGVNVTGIKEKPVDRHFVNAGMYLLSPLACQMVPKGKPFDMPDLVARLLSQGLRVVGFPLHEYWLDIGKIEDYQRAQADWKQPGQAS